MRLAWREIAIQRRDGGDYEGALCAAKRAFELGGDYPEVLVTYARLLGEFGQFAEQRRLLERARALGLEDWRFESLDWPVATAGRRLRSGLTM